MVRSIKMMAAGLVIVMLSGCATIISDSDYEVQFSSDPTGATFIVTDSHGVEVHRGVTPSMVNLSASRGYFDGEEYTVVFEVDGHQSKPYPLESGYDAWYLGNVVIGGWIGMLIVDPATGAMFTLDESVHGVVNTAVASHEANIVVTSTDQLNDKQKTAMVPLSL